jgi:hypothetical protein
MANKPLETLVIRFEAQNTKAVKKAVKDVGAEFEKTGKKAKKEIGRARVATEGLRRSLGAVRNNLLLVAFATEGARRAFNGFIEARGQLEKFEARLRAMSGSAEIASRQLQVFMDIASRTPFTVEEIVQGGVQLQAFGADAEALTETMGNLAAFMDRSVPEAANAFGRAFAGGRGAADVFRETGILTIIDSFESLDESLNKSKLTLTEFRIKMIEALSDPKGDIADGLNQLEGTLFQSFSNMEDAIFMFRARVGQELQPFFLAFAKSVKDLFNSFDITFIRDVGAAIKAALGTAIAFTINMIANAIITNRAYIATLFTMRTAAMAAAAGVNAVGAALKRNYIGIIITAGVVAFQFFERFKARQDEAAAATAKASKTVEQYLDELRELRAAEQKEEETKAIAENILKLEEQLRVIQATNAVEAAQARLTRILTKEETDLIEKIEEHKESIKELLEVERERERFLEGLKKLELENEDLLNARFDARHDLLEADLSDFTATEERKNEIQEEFTNRNLKLEELTRARKEAIGNLDLIAEGDRAEKREIIEENFKNKKIQIEQETNDRINEMKQGFVDEDAAIKEQQLEAERAFNLLRQDLYFETFSNIQSAFAKMVKSNFDQELRALKKTDKFRKASTEQREDMENDLKEKFAAQQRLAFMAQQALQIANIFMQLSKTKFDIDSAAAARIMANPKNKVAIEAQAATLKKRITIGAAIQTGIVAAQPMPAFARGGSFITSGPQSIMVGDNPGGRERVDVTPLSSPNFDGPDGSAVTVNIMGNVIGTEEFVRDSLIPEIDRSIRRNLA